MSGISKIMAGLTLLLGLMFAIAPAQAEPIQVLDSATRTVDGMMTDPMFGPSRQILRDARAVLIIPHLLKGGFNSPRRRRRRGAVAAHGTPLELTGVLHDRGRLFRIADRPRRGAFRDVHHDRSRAQGD